MEIPVTQMSCPSNNVSISSIASIFGRLLALFHYQGMCFRVSQIEAAAISGKSKSLALLQPVSLSLQIGVHVCVSLCVPHVGRYFR